MEDADQRSISDSVLVRASGGGKMHTQAGRDQAPICVHSSTGHEREAQFWKKKAQAAAMAAWQMARTDWRSTLSLPSPHLGLIWLSLLKVLGAKI